MNTVGSYFVEKNEDGVALKENIIMGKKYRFTVLSERLIRLEYNQNGIFEDRTTQRVIKRNFPKVDYKIEESETLVQIVTSYFTLNYVKEKNFVTGNLSSGNILRITLNGTDRVWNYNHPEVRNFGGISYSLDDFDGNLKLEKGLYSTDGFTCLDDTTSFILENGSYINRKESGIDLYVFMYKKDFGLCLQDYYNLTGYPMLIPRYALGTWWYKNNKYNQYTLDSTLTKFKEENVGLSAIILGNDWHLKDDPLVFDEANLGAQVFNNLGHKHSLKTGITINPSQKAKSNTYTYQNIVANLGPLKEGEYSFLPLSNQSLNLYTNYGINNWISAGIDVFVNDYNNIKDKRALALFNHYCYALGALNSNKRIAVLSRNHDIATHRNTIIFTGKTKVDWETLTVLPRYNSTASNNGISYIAHAIGGYYGGIENFELYIRYIQLGVFSTMLVLACDRSEYYKREPWRWNATQSLIIKKYLNLRQALIPYLYTESYIYHNNGSPIVQPLYYKYPKIYDEPNYKNQYFFGSKMLVCPITKKKNLVMNRVVHRMFIPEGVWYELESGKKYLGNKYYMSFYKDEDYPVFCMEGAIIPISLDKTDSLPANMEIIIFPGCDGEYKLYEDDGFTTNYKNCTITEFSFQYQKTSYELSIKPGTNSEILPNLRNYKLRFKNTKAVNLISILNGNKSIPGNYYIEQNDLIIDVQNVSTGSALVIKCESDESLENSTIRLINDDIRGIIEDLEIETTLKEKIGAILFGDMTIKKKRIAIRKLKSAKLEPKFIKMFLNLLEYIGTV